MPILISFAGARVKPSYKEMAKKAVFGGVKEIFSFFLSEDDSKAQLKGKSDCLRVIEYMKAGKLKLKVNGNKSNPKIVKDMIYEIENPVKEDKKNSEVKSKACCCVIF